MRRWNLLVVAYNCGDWYQAGISDTETWPSDIRKVNIEESNLWFCNSVALSEYVRDGSR